MQLIDTRFGRTGYPTVVEYTECDDPKKWNKYWQARKSASRTRYYKKQTSRRDIFYHLNSQGYREKEWNQINWNESYVFLGCSHTFGVGVGHNETIPAQIQFKTGINCINLGIPGGNNAFSMFNSAKLINQGIKPLKVFFQRAFAFRWFDYNDNYGPIPYIATDKAYRKFYISDKYVNYLDVSISETIASQWKHICPIIEYNIEMFDDRWNPRYLARDGTHFNRLYFEKVVNRLLED